MTKRMEPTRSKSAPCGDMWEAGEYPTELSMTEEPSLRLADQLITAGDDILYGMT